VVASSFSNESPAREAARSVHGIDRTLLIMNGEPCPQLRAEIGADPFIVAVIVTSEEDIGNSAPPPAGALQAVSLLPAGSDYVRFRLSHGDPEGEDGASFARGGADSSVMGFRELSGDREAGAAASGLPAP
jgi:hypothetical protein